MLQLLSIQLVLMLHLSPQCHLPLEEIYHCPQVFEDPQRHYGTSHCTGKHIVGWKIVGGIFNIHMKIKLLIFVIF